MLIETGLLLNVQGNRALVRTSRSDACSGCSSQGTCHSMGGSKDMEVLALNYLRAKEGDRVELALPETSFLKASAITYLLPLMAILGGAILGQGLAGMFGWSADTASIVLAGLCLGLALLLMAYLNRKLADQERYIPRITRILPPLSSDGEPGVGEICEA